ncbi:hypothetical protein [Tabrizicola fusiformis]|uniref:hypothetical protein n=1 Tax=Tabrizicola sp. SY72 TaxID=2741673 RepID=UPI00157346DE|nr:hypothetical protein [Tabrizicola sp. SY72]NTT88499.1 hypothetical protein [Tabrizicola sp. SY72]
MTSRKVSPAPSNTQGENGAAQPADTPIRAEPETVSGEAATGDGATAPAASLSPGRGIAGGDGGRVEKGLATVISPIDHDGQSYQIGEPLPLTRDEFAALVKAGAVQDEDWEELPIPF